MQEFMSWTQFRPAKTFDLQQPEHLAHLWDRYGGTNPAILNSVLSHASAVGARGVLAEHRYIDADYRSEHSRFYSTTFRRYPSITHRLHFFGEILDPGEVFDTSLPVQFDKFGYLGFSIVRPVEANAIGRTMMTPTTALRDFVSCRATERVNLFGTELEVEAAPFAAQDSQLSVCSHVSAWLCSYYHHLRFRAPRRLAAEIAASTPINRDRLVPSAAVSVSQLVHLLSDAGLPPVTYDLDNLPSGETVVSLACRYLDSEMPVVVGAGGHSFVLVGYRWVRDRAGRIRVQFIRQDDERGAYQIVESIDFDRYTPWRHLVIPLPEKVYMSGEGAQKLGQSKIEKALSDSSEPSCQAVLDDLSAGDLTYKASVHLSNEVKRWMTKRSPGIAAAYCWLQLPKWVWVIELVSKSDWHTNSPSVVAEALVDATGHAQDERVLGWRIPGAVGWTLPDWEINDFVKVEDVSPQESIVRTDTTIVGL